jgi:hypothetical protein
VRERLRARVLWYLSRYLEHWSDKLKRWMEQVDRARGFDMDGAC